MSRCGNRTELVLPHVAFGDPSAHTTASTGCPVTQSSRAPHLEGEPASARHVRAEPAYFGASPSGFTEPVCPLSSLPTWLSISDCLLGAGTVQTWQLPSETGVTS